jgi:glutamine synthetase adenylyltransferase
VLKLIEGRPCSRRAAQELLREHGFRDVPRVSAAIGRFREDELERRNLQKIFGHLIRLDLLITVFAHSQALADTLTRNAENLHFLIAPGTLEEPREKALLEAELTRLLLPLRASAQKYDTIRRFRRRETLRIGARDLIGRATVEETTFELSNLADVCLQAVFEIAASRYAFGTS